MLPLYDIKINMDDDTGVDYNALVDSPAHRKGFISFSKDHRIAYSFDEEAEGEKRMVTGVMISADTIIYRNDSVHGEHEVRFRADEVEKIHKKFHLNGFNNNLNEMHDGDKSIAGVVMMESYIIGTGHRAQAPEAFADQHLKDGTWIATYFIEDDAIWEKVKDGTFMGFSVEGLFERVPAQRFKMAKGKFGSITEVSKWDVEVDQDDFEIGTALTRTWKYEDGTEEVSRIDDGEYMLPDGSRILVDSDGIIRNKFTEIEMKNKKRSLWDLAFGKKDPKQTFAEVTTVDGVVLSYEGTLEVGTSLMSKDEEGNEIPAPAGDHQVQVDDKSFVITLDDQGVVTAMEEVEADDEMSAQEFATFMKKYDTEIKEFIAEKMQPLEELSLAQQKVIDLLIDGKDDKFKNQVRQIAGEQKTFSDIIRNAKH